MTFTWEWTQIRTAIANGSISAWRTRKSAGWSSISSDSRRSIRYSREACSPMLKVVSQVDNGNQEETTLSIIMSANVTNMVLKNRLIALSWHSTISSNIKMMRSLLLQAYPIHILLCISNCLFTNNNQKNYKTLLSKFLHWEDQCAAWTSLLCQSSIKCQN